LVDKTDSDSIFSPNPDGSVNVSRIQVPGTVIDSEGHSWAIPEEDPTGDEYKLYRSPFDINKNEQFHYQFDHEKDVSQQMADGFVPCTRRELGLPDFKGGSNEYGQGEDGTYKVGDLVCMKIPKVLADRRYKALQRVANAAVNATDVKNHPNGKVIYDSETAGVKADALERQRNGKGRKYEMSHQKVSVRAKHPENERQ
jgi:hypothetical protein